MANPVCTRDSLVTAGTCYKLFRRERERMALRAYFNVLELAAIGGTNYTNSMNNALIDDANCLKNLSLDQQDVAQIVIDSQNATNAGASVSTSMTTLATAIACLNNFSDFQLRAILLHLRCRLGTHKSYPQ